MSDTEIQIVWIVTALFFGLGQVGVQVVAGMGPRTPDEAIDFLELIVRPLIFFFDVTFVALAFGVVMTWVYELNEGTRVVSVVVASTITVLAAVSFFALRRIATNILFDRLRGVIR